MTPEQIARLRGLLDKATPGPWSCPEGTRVWGQVGKKYLPVVDAVLHRGTSKNAHYTAALIAESRNALPDLLDALAARDAEIARLNRLVKAIQRDTP